MEYKPKNTRRESSRNIGNQYANQYQNQNKQLFGNQIITNQLPHSSSSSIENNNNNYSST